MFNVGLTKQSLCFKIVLITWTVFRVASENIIDIYTDSVTGFIRKCIEDVVPTGKMRIYPKQKSWIYGSIPTKLRWSRNSMAQTQGPQTIKYYKGKDSYAVDNATLLPDKLNTFFALFEENNIEPPAAYEDCVLSFSFVAHISSKNVGIQFFLSLTAECIM